MCLVHPRLYSHHRVYLHGLTTFTAGFLQGLATVTFNFISYLLISHSIASYQTGFISLARLLNTPPSLDFHPK